MNEQGWIVWLRPIPGRGLVPFRPDHWPPRRRLLVDIDDDSIPPMGAKDYEQVKRDASSTWTADVAELKRVLPEFRGILDEDEAPNARRTKVEPRRSFYQLVDYGMTLWGEGRIVWVDVPV